MQNSPEYGISDLWALLDTVENPKRRQQLRDLFTYLDSEAGLREIPASCYMHASYRDGGGYLDHCVRVAKTALILRDALAPKMSRDSVVTVALLHDQAKSGFPLVAGTVRRYQPNPTFDERREVSAYNRPWRYNPAQPTFPMGPISGVIAAKWLDLTVAEVQAICGSDGQYCLDNRQYAHHETPLLMLVSMADTWAGHVVEGGLDPNAWNQPGDVLLSNHQGECAWES